MENKDLYYVAVKVFLQDADGRLLITKDRFGDWDIPGGRLREVDFNAPLTEIVARKMKEELGATVSYELGEPTIFMRHERDEHLPDGTRARRRIFAVGYRAMFKGGDITLGKNHETYEWVPLESFMTENYFTGGWLEGVKEFQARFRSK
jgi:ADP-ribose pyrophosphatase YjhB (NUDIX family)